MDLLRPRGFFLVAAANLPLQLPYTQIDTRIPRGAWFRLDYILARYPVTRALGAQTSPDLNFELINSNGVKHQNEPVRFGAVTTPAYGDRIRAAWGMRILFEPGKVIQMRVTGQVPGPLPATVSVTYVGQMGWGRR